MDYTKVPRKLIYEDKANLKDFFVDQPGTLDAIMFDRIQRSKICELEDARTLTRDIFNNAYYITTLILMEKYPALHLISYFNISMSAGGGKHTYKRYFSAMTMAMVYNYLRASDQQYFNDQQVLIKRIWDYHGEHYQDGQWDGKARFLFFKNVLPLIDVKNHKMRDVFNPRPIQNVVLFEDAKTILMGQGLDYVMNSITSLRKTEDAIQCFDELIQKLKRAAILGREDLIKEVEDYKKEFRCIREEPPIRKGKNGNLIEQPQEEEVADATTYSGENELETKVQVLQEELERVSSEKESTGIELKESHEKLQTVVDEQKSQIEKLKADNALIPQLQQKVSELEKQLSENQSGEEKIEIPRHRIRIEMLNFLFAKLGYDTKWITENRKATALARVYASILGINKAKSIWGDVGKVVYSVRPPELDGEIAEVNKFLQDINNDWKIEL